MSWDSLSALMQEADRCGCTIGHVIMRDEGDGAMERMKRNWAVMKEAARQGLESPVLSRGGMLHGGGARLLSYAQTGGYCGGNVLLAVASALAISEYNAAMGRIVAAPTAGAAGILPGILIMIQKNYAKTDDEIALALFTAAGIGMVIDKRATLSGAQGGCQAECGSAAAMAAGAAAQLAGGSPRVVLEAAALSLKNQLGLVCDPVGGLVEVPCAKRNAISAAHALAAADLALAGIASVIPADEVIDAMGKIGKQMPACLRETSQGGLADTPTGRAIRDGGNGSGDGGTRLS